MAGISLLTVDTLLGFLFVFCFKKRDPQKQTIELSQTKNYSIPPNEISEIETGEKMKAGYSLTLYSSSCVLICELAIAAV